MDEIQKKTMEMAEAAQKAITEILPEKLPEPDPNIVAMDEAEGATREEIEARLRELDMKNTQSIIKLGSGTLDALHLLLLELHDVVQAIQLWGSRKRRGACGSS